MLLTASPWLKTVMEEIYAGPKGVLAPQGLGGVLWNLQEYKLGPLFSEYIKGLQERYNAYLKHKIEVMLHREDLYAETEYDNFEYEIVDTWCDVTYVMGDFDHHEQFMSSEPELKVKQEVANLAFIYATYKKHSNE